jgi:predicted nucleic acid-binding protein
VNAQAPAFEGGVYIADTSAWEWVRRTPTLRDEWERAIRADQIRTCPIVNLELLYVTRNAQEFTDLEEELSALRSVPIARSEFNATFTALRELAAMRPLYHRVPLPDVLVAAAAQSRGIGVLHYDRHYDRLAEVMEFESRWLASEGTL